MAHQKIHCSKGRFVWLNHIKDCPKRAVGFDFDRWPDANARAMALLKAFFDETGTHQGSPITGIGGFVGPCETWQQLEPQWAGVLAEFADKGVRWFHMSEAIVQKGQFAALEKWQVDYQSSSGFRNKLFRGKPPI
jgi:hypothetical protein